MGATKSAAGLAGEKWLSAGAPRIVLIEWLRVAAALGIVWYHSGVAGAQIGYVGLIIFLILAAYFAARSPGSLVSYRASRLLLPWAIWSLVYGLAHLARHEPVVPLEHGLLLGILTGSNAHLWFLPFAFVATIALGAVPTRFRQLAGWATAIGAVGLAASIGIWRPTSMALGLPVAQWAHALLPTLAGATLGYFGVGRLGLGSSAVLIACLCLYLGGEQFELVAVYIAGIVVTGAALLTPRWIDRRLPSASAIFSCMLGVYLVHILVLKVVELFVSGIAVPLIAFAVSLCGVLAVRHFFARLSRLAT